jgi:menaquinone-dependent protoporphyrinogen IX oxidase
LKEGRMRVGIVYFPSNSGETPEKIAKALAKSLEQIGHDPTVINGDVDSSTKLSLYDYVAVIAKAVSLFGGKLHEKVGTFLANAGTVSGKRSCAFAIKTPFGSEKALARLMRAMEREGMFVNYSQIVRIPEDASESGKRLPIARS